METLLQLIGRVIVASRYQALSMVTLILLAGCDKSALLRAPPAPAAVPVAVSAKATAPTQTQSAQGDTSIKALNDKNFAVIQVYYATDRSRSGQAEPAKLYGGKRGALSYGSCEVSLPRDHKMEKLEAQSISRLEFRDAPANRPVLRKVAPRQYEAYLDHLKTVIAKSSQKNAFVFVHGYNVTFAEAARRTAQLKYDLGFEGAPIFFSWPSKGRTDAYAADEADVEWAQPDLKEFLKEVAGKTKARNIYLIAHSMGNRALTKAYIYLISERPELKKVFREVILVAPDIDSDLFKREIAPALAASANHTTLYTSSKDATLKAANKFQDYPRAGDSGSNLVLFDGIETIDATNVSTALMGHTYIADNSSVIADIYHLIREGKSPGERSGLKTVHATSGQYWRFKAR
jgi:esterase/lipase superfamily enzyme